MNYADFDIHIKTAQQTGEYKSTCPKCSHERKKKTQKCLSVNLDKQIWHCAHCSWSGGLPKNLPKIERKVYVKPIWKNTTQLDDRAVKWFESRGIRQHVLNEAKVTTGLEWMPQTGKEVNTIQFNYFRDGELVNVKYRDAKKNFKLHKGSELIFYNLDAIKEVSEVIIVEGEMDALSFIAAGITNVVSVPNGATIGSTNLEYVDNCIDLFDDKNILIATDNDVAGRNLRLQLAERFGLERCKYLEFGSFKDINEVLIAEGIDGVIKCKQKALDFPLEGVFTVADYDEALNDLYINGLDRGRETGMGQFDEHIRFVQGYITTITGIPGHGKSDFVDQICLKLALLHDWRGAFYSPENKPTQLHLSKMCRKLSAKSWFGQDRLSQDDLAMCKEYLNDRVYFIEPEDNFTIDTILAAVRVMKKRHGIHYFVIDAWNKLEHQYTESETKYIGETMDKIERFCKINNVHCFLVAHPKKMNKRKDSVLFEIPTLYDVAGSANFYNKTDNGLVVYRNFEDNTVMVGVLKVKFDHWGYQGSVDFQYDKPSGRYFTNYSKDMVAWIERPDQPRAEQPSVLKPNKNFYETEKEEDDEIADIDRHF
jgi:twinkle protein